MVRDMLVVTMFAVVAALARIAQDAVMAWKFGAGPVVDAYCLMTSLAACPVAVALSMLTWLVPPTEAALRQQPEKFARLFRSELLGVSLVVAVLAWPFTGWALSYLLNQSMTGLQPTAAALALTAIRPAGLAVCLGLLGALLSAWLLASGRHVLTLLEALPAAVLTIVVLLIHGPGSALFWGAAAGIAVQVLCMCAVVMALHGPLVPRLGFASPVWRSFSRGAAGLLVGQMLFALVPLVDPLLAARQAEGTVAALSFAMRLVLGVQGLAGLGLQRACLPRLSALMIEDPLKARAFTLRWAGIAAVAGAFIGVAVAAMAEPVVTLLFEHGRFTAGNSEQVAALLRLGMLQMPPFLAGLVLVASLASAHARRQMALIAALGMGAKLLLSLALVERFGVEGLLGATALMYALTALVAGLALGKLAVMSAPAN